MGQAKALQHTWPLTWLNIPVDDLVGVTLSDCAQNRSHITCHLRVQHT